MTYQRAETCVPRGSEIERALNGCWVNALHGTTNSQSSTLVQFQPPARFGELWLRVGLLNPARTPTPHLHESSRSKEAQPAARTEEVVQHDATLLRARVHHKAEEAAELLPAREAHLRRRPAQKSTAPSARL